MRHDPDENFFPLSVRVGLLATKGPAPAPAPDVNIECFGLGGRDLESPTPWQTCSKTDRHGQRIYGPSLASVEKAVAFSNHTFHLTILGLTKSMQEFLVLHYLAMDSAEMWHKFSEELNLQAHCLEAGMRRQALLEMLHDTHVAPS